MPKRGSIIDTVHHISTNLRVSSKTLSPLQRQSHTKNVRRLEKIYLIFLMLEAIALIYSAVWLINVTSNPGTDYKTLPLWYIVPTYLFLVGVIVSTILRFSCCTCTNDTVTNIDTAILHKLLCDPLIVFNLTLATLNLMLELADPASNMTYANALVFYCQFISILFSDALIRADKWFTIINVSTLLFQGIIHASFIIFIAKDRFYFIVNTTPYTRNLSKRFVIVQIIAGMVPILLEAVQDPHRYHIHFLSCPLYRFQLASVASFQQVTKQQKYAIVQTLAAKEQALLDTRKNILKNYGGMTKKVSRATMINRFSNSTLKKNLSTNSKIWRLTENRTEANYVMSTVNKKKMEMLFLIDEVIFSLLCIILFIMYMIEVQHQHNYDIRIIQQSTNISFVSNSSMAEPIQNDHYKYPVVTIALFWTFSILLILLMIRRFFCCGKNTNIDMIIMKKLITDPIVVYLGLCAILMVMTDILWPTEYTHLNITLKIAYCTTIFTFLLSDALIQVSRWFDVLLTTLFFATSLNNQIQVWSGSHRGPDLIIFNSTCESPIGPIPTFTKGTLLKALYTQIFVNLILVLYRIWWDKKRTHLRLLTDTIYRHDFMDVAELNLRSAKKAEEIMAYITELISNITSIKQRNLKIVQDNIRRTTLDDESKMIEMRSNPLEEAEEKVVESVVNKVTVDRRSRQDMVQSKKY